MLLSFPNKDPWSEAQAKRLVPRGLPGALRDAGALRAVLARAGAELVLHGHGHRTLFSEVPGPAGPIPVVGARSASDATDRPEKCAQYPLYDLEPGDGGFRITARIRGYDGAGGFAAVGERVLVD